MVDSGVLVQILMNPDKKPPGGDKKPPTVKPQKPSAKDDPRNAQYKKMRDDLNQLHSKARKIKRVQLKLPKRLVKMHGQKQIPLAAAKKKEMKLEVHRSLPIL